MTGRVLKAPLWLLILLGGLALILLIALGAAIGWVIDRD